MASDDDGWLMSAPTDSDDIRAFYDDWATRYDSDLAGWDYRAPARIAGLLAANVELTVPLLDAGCGTGLSGRALRAAGFSGPLTGIDVSAESLALAGSSGIYTDVTAASLSEPLPFDDAAFGAVASVGVLTYVPDVEPCWREWCRVTQPGGVISFTQREDLWAERGCRETIDRLIDDGCWDTIVISDPEPYLPGTDGDLADVGAHAVAMRVC